MNNKAKNTVAVSFILVCIALLVIGMVVAGPRKACNDGTDNDGDGFVDWPADPGCANKNDNTETNSALVCDNGADASNDADTLVDSADPGCSSPTDTSEIDGNCDDLSDNDGDSVADYPADPGCASYSDASELGTNECDDGFDNADADSLVDYNDSGCSGPADTSEVSGQCDDGTDNDGDTFIDYPADPQCTAYTDNVEAPDNSCSDTDGFNVFVAGSVSGYSGGSPYSNSDGCVNSTFVTEWYCGGTNPYSTASECPFNNVTNTTGICGMAACS